MIEDIGKHYLYRHVRLDTNEVFYVGIGTKSKNKSINDYHRSLTKANRNNYWKHIIEKTEYDVEIILESNDYNFIKQKEIEFIALYGRKDLIKGTLVNLTDGGDGNLGYKATKESIKKRVDQISTKVVEKATGLVFNSISEVSEKINCPANVLGNRLYKGTDLFYAYEDETLRKEAETRYKNRISSLNRRLNKNINKTSDCVGVSYDKTRNKWFCQVRDIDGKKVFLGRYVMEKEACEAYSNYIEIIRQQTLKKYNV